MANWIRIPTSAEVAAVIRARHGKELTVFGSFSDPDGRFNGGAGDQGRMDTMWGFNGADAPILEARTTWGIDPEQEHKRINEKHDYFLCCGQTDED